MTSHAPAPITVDELRAVPLLADLPEHEIAWLAAACEALEADGGTVLFEVGEPIDRMWIALSGLGEFVSVEGEVRLVPVSLRPGDITGRLPYSRLRVAPGRGLVSESIRAAVLPASRFSELVVHAPLLTERLVHVMVDRARSYTRADAQREKLVGLGTMAAGLAHELDNPASAARRDADGLAGVLERFADVGSRLVRHAVHTRPGGDAVAPALDDLIARATGAPGDALVALDPLVRSDRESELAAWLRGIGVLEPWDAAVALQEAGVDRDAMAAATAPLGPELQRDLVGWIAAMAALNGLGRHLAEATDRISTLVAAMKSYTYMDQADRQSDVDVVKGIRDTVSVLGHRLRDRGVTLHDELPDLPKIRGHGSELNQVWTNLIDNASAAAAEGGGTVWIRGELHAGAGDVTIEIRDDGPGIPPASIHRIFEPFFTTKEVGAGTGMGLDIASRIVRERHRGRIDVDSQPGDTRFRVRLPIDGASSQTRQRARDTGSTP